MSILEPMACGKPVVSPQVEGISGIISHDREGLRVNGKEAEDYASASLALVRNCALRQQTGRTAREKNSYKFQCLKNVPTLLSALYEY